jgi:hypothetical protein
VTLKGMLQGLCSGSDAVTTEQMGYHACAWACARCVQHLSKQMRQSVMRYQQAAMGVAPSSIAGGMMRLVQLNGRLCRHWLCG